MRALSWLTARPVAHRGLHDVVGAMVENTASAFSAAIAGGYGIECDLQLSADGEAIVHHDAALGRLTEGRGLLRDMSAAALRRVPFRGTADRMIALGELCDLVAGRVALLVELKSAFDGEDRLVRRVADVLRGSTAPVAAMSFDPQHLEALRALAPGLTRGIVAERHYRHADWAGLTAGQRRSMALLLHAPRTRPHFVAYRVADLPALAPLVARHVCGLPLLTWTVRSAQDRAIAARWASQIIFEGFRP
jgi:glycerophosphoryl diester phosphodiesterase